MSTPTPPRGRATMKDVAALAGAGVKTVSRVINNEPNVTPAMAKRVWDAVRELDYQVDLQAGSLRRADGRTRTLGLLVGSVDNPFAGVIHRTVEDAAAEKGVAVFAASMDDDARRESDAVRTLLQRRVDGLILTTAVRRPEYLGTIRDRGVPVVYVDREPEGADLDTVASSNRAGAEAGTAHLIAHGHRRIALLADRLDLITAHQRHSGYLDALAAAGIPVSEEIIITELTDAEAGAKALSSLLALDDPPTAVFSAQNLITIGALHALRDAQLSHSVALVGFDDLPLADLVEPGVTVIAQDPQRIGVLAAERIFARLEGDHSAPVRMHVPTTLIPRGTGEIAPRRVSGGIR
ncbi:LacI family DNA-binding transcriptional regulator [Microbacterium murale]|uniref:DNA-binding LacI/PurR family transcriptional regulator n=1 Tax=Microbacterium murale TaxID=1081040 RepID=A0ABU0PC40_9MICO|nr:LacI family DNA-binding transcriptional regulator [Microbacterium murale]MDQ0644912.1 DNA-binding LacI/PurR family transcriptional regulator [Microbacterium murale]